MEEKDDHCKLSQPLSDAEKKRLMELLRQQDITLPESDLIAYVKEVGARQNCPFRFDIGQGMCFCASENYLKKIFQPKRDA